MLYMSATGPTVTKPFLGKVDSASDETLLDETLAHDIGVNLLNAPTCTFGGIVQGGYTARFAQVVLRLTDGIEFREWPAWVGFVAGLRRPVLGIAGFLQFFTTTLFGDDEVVEVQINRLYPGK